MPAYCCCCSIELLTWYLQLGTETEGSLMAPAERTGATGMRPSFGIIGRSGVMTLVDSLVCPIWDFTVLLRLLQLKLH